MVRTIGYVMGTSTTSKGSVHEQHELMNEARQKAIDSMVAQAGLKDANAIVGMRIETSATIDGSFEIIVYGTAVIVE